MQITQPSETLAQTFFPVKSLNSQLPLPFSKGLRHHSNLSSKIIIGDRDKIWKVTSYYGVSSDYRLLTKGLFIKRFDYVRDFLKDVLGLSLAQRDFTLRLLEYWSHYGKVYPKINLLCEEPGCSKATAWRTITILEGLGLIERVNRIMKPARRQISNLYLLHGLILLIARYLAEHGVAFWEKWLKPVLTMPGRQFWSQVWETPEVRAGPGAVAYSGP